MVIPGNISSRHFSRKPGYLKLLVAVAAAVTLIAPSAFGQTIGTTPQSSPAIESAAQAPTTAPSTEPAMSQFTEEQIFQGWGWLLVNQRRMAKIEIKDTELAAFLKGARDSVHGQPAPNDMEKSFWDIQRFSKERRTKVNAAIRQEKLEEANKFVADLKKSPDIFELPSGVIYKVVKPGDGPQPLAQQTVIVHFFGHTLDGTEFVEFGPTENILVPGQAFCRGWIDALQKMKKGEQIKLYVPPPLSDEESEKWGVPPGSMLVFDIDLQDIHPTDAKALEDVLIPPPPQAEGPSRSDLTDEQVFECWGWSVGQGTGLPFTEAQTAWFLKGLAAGIKGDPLAQNADDLSQVVERIAGEREQKAAQVFKQKQLAAADDFFSKLKQQPGITSLPDGLCYELKAPGTGEFPKPGQIVVVNYTGTLINGKEFDKSTDEPLSIELGRYMPGWDEGIQKLRKGGKMKLYIPPALAYGDESAAGVLPNSTLIYDIELLDIKDQPATEPSTEPAMETTSAPTQEPK